VVTFVQYCDDLMCIAMICGIKSIRCYHSGMGIIRNIMLKLVLVSESWCKGSCNSFARSPVVDEERMSPG